VGETEGGRNGTSLIVGAGTALSVLLSIVRADLTPILSNHQSAFESMKGFTGILRDPTRGARWKPARRALQDRPEDLQIREFETI
jgi:hypothetical protein